MQPLAGIKVLDFSTLLPGPLATLILAEAGADVIKIERPGRGDEMRSYVPKFGSDSVNFALLNRGKKSLAVDLKNATVREQLLPTHVLLNRHLGPWRFLNRWPGLLLAADRTLLALGAGHDAAANKLLVCRRRA